MFCYFRIYRFLQRMSDSFLMMCYLSYCLRRVLLKNSIVHRTFERKQLSIYYESQLKSMFLFYRLLCLLFVLLLRKYSPLIFVLLRLYFIFLLLIMNEYKDFMGYARLFLILKVLLFALVCRNHPLPCV